MNRNDTVPFFNQIKFPTFAYQYFCSCTVPYIHGASCKSGFLCNPWSSGNTCLHTQHCGYWCPGAEAPGHHYPQCWQNFHFIRPVSYKIITCTLILSIVKKRNYFMKTRPSCLGVNKPSNLIKQDWCCWPNTFSKAGYMLSLHVRWRHVSYSGKDVCWWCGDLCQGTSWVRSNGGRHPGATSG